MKKECPDSSKSLVCMLLVCRLGHFFIIGYLCFLKTAILYMQQSEGMINGIRRAHFTAENTFYKKMKVRMQA